MLSGKRPTNISVNSASCSNACLRQRIRFPWCFCLRGASCRVRTYRFCPFFMGLRYVLTFPAAFQAVRSPMQSQNVSFLLIFLDLRYVFTFPAAFLPARGFMQSQNVSFLSIFRGFTIRFHFFCGVSACAGLHAESERIVFVHFSWVYDTFSLFLRCFCLRGASCRVRTYRFCPFFVDLRYVFTFSAVFLPALSSLHGVGSSSNT